MCLKLISRIKIQKLNEVALGWIVFSIYPNELYRVVLFSLFPPLASLKELCLTYDAKSKDKYGIDNQKQNNLTIL